MTTALDTVRTIDWPTAALAWPIGWIVTATAAGWLTARLIPWLRRHGAVVPATATNADPGMPRGGGLSLVVIVATVALCIGTVDRAAAVRLAGGLLPAMVVALVSLCDDFRPLPALGRLAVHVAAAALATAALGPVREIDVPILGTFPLGVAAWPITVLWIAGLTNAFNFMDGSDGIAGITAAATATALAVAAALQADLAVAVVAAALSAAAVGFLSCNWHPARVFMGDVGSTWCGFLIAVMPLAMPAADRRAAALQVVACATWPFLFDTGWTLLKRLWRRENVLVAHRDHIYQRLVSAGWSHRVVAMMYGSLAALGGAIGALPVIAPTLAGAADVLVVVSTSAGAGLLLCLAAGAGTTAARERPLPAAPRGWYAGPGKRVCDVLAAVLLLVLLAPVMMAVWLAVRIVLGPPAIFAEERAGRGGRPIRIEKFRSMTQATDADGQLLPDAERLGPFGVFLRRTSLDELPQLFSVLRGDMSMVGPRPLPLRYLARYDDRQAIRLVVRPGLTGWAQIHGRNAVDWPRRLEYDAEYVVLLGRWQAPFTDCWIVCATVVQLVWQALTGRGIGAPGAATMQEFQP